jgi:hypothetical protein
VCPFIGMVAATARRTRARAAITSSRLAALGRAGKWPHERRGRLRIARGRRCGSLARLHFGGHEPAKVDRDHQTAIDARPKGGGARAMSHRSRLAMSSGYPRRLTRARSSRSAYSHERVITESKVSSCAIYAPPGRNPFATSQSRTMRRINSTRPTPSAFAAVLSAPISQIRPRIKTTINPRERHPT